MSTDVIATVTGLSAKIATEIRGLLGRQAMSRSELARRLGVDDTWVGKRLNCRTEIGANDMERIAEVLGVEIVDLLPRDRRTPTVTSIEPLTPLHAGSPFGKYPSGGRPSNRKDPRRPSSTAGLARHSLARTA